MCGVFLASCANDSSLESEVKAIETDLKIHRFDLEFGQGNVADFDRLRDKYPFFFPSQTPDSIWKFKLQDTVEKQISREINRVLEISKPLPLNCPISTLISTSF